MSKHTLFPETEIYLKPANKFWDNYKGQDKVIMEDMDYDKLNHLDQEIKIWTDEYAFAPEIKHGQLGKIRPKHFIITSQFHYSEIFPTTTVLALNRRMDVYSFKIIDNKAEYVY